jgi:hypothetical protein
MISVPIEGGSRGEEDNRVRLDIGDLQRVSWKVTKLLRKECKDAMEAMYVLKATL